MRFLPSTISACLVLSAAACSPAPGSVLSDELIGIPPGSSEIQACTDLCLADAGPGCTECGPATMPDGGPAVLCVQVECGPPPTGHD